MSKACVSVYMTVKNGERYVGEAIASIVGQTLAAWEMIVVDDGSSDGTLALLQQIARADERVRVIPTLGVGRARALNVALWESRAAYVANLDADDLSHPERLELQTRTLAMNPAYDVLCSSCVHISAKYSPRYSAKHSDSRWFPSKGRSFPPEGRWFPPKSDDARVTDVTGRLPFGNPVVHSSVIAKRTALLSIGGYDESRRSHVDYDLWIRLARSHARIGRLDIPLTLKRLHPEQSFSETRRFRYLAESLRMQARAIRSLDGGKSAWAALAARAAWGMLPQAVRCRSRPTAVGALPPF